MWPGAQSPRRDGYRPVTRCDGSRWTRRHGCASLEPPELPVRRTILLFAAVVLVVLTGGAAHAAGPVRPYFAPPFAHECTVHRFGEGVAPDITAFPDDP